MNGVSFETLHQSMQCNSQAVIKLILLSQLKFFWPSQQHFYSVSVYTTLAHPTLIQSGHWLFSFMVRKFSLSLFSSSSPLPFHICNFEGKCCVKVVTNEFMKRLKEVLGLLDANTSAHASSCSKYLYSSTLLSVKCILHVVIGSFSKFFYFMYKI